MKRAQGRQEAARILWRRENRLDIESGWSEDTGSGKRYGF